MQGPTQGVRFTEVSVKRDSIVIVTYCYATKPRNPGPSGQSLTLFVFLLIELRVLNPKYI